MIEDVGSFLEHRPGPRVAGHRGALALAIVMLCTALVFIATPTFQLKTAFIWHVAQPQTWQGGLEALALFLLLAAAFVTRTRWLAACLVVVPALLFTRRHAVDVSILVDLVQFEIVVGLGILLRRGVGLPSAARAFDYVEAFVAGLVIWSLCAWTASALGFGSIKALRWLTLLLVIPAAFGSHRPLLLFLWSAMRVQSTGARVWCAALAAWLLVLFARTKTAIGHDSAWYGLQGEHVLAPVNGVFESVGLVSPVHYYPKLHEMFLLPLSGLGDSSVLLGMSILPLMLLLVVCAVLLRQWRTPEPALLPTLALIASLPALANVSGETKPDVLAVLLVMLATLRAIEFARSRSLVACAWVVTAGALACCTKLTSIPYVGMLVLATAVASGLRRDEPALLPADAAARRFAFVVSALAVPVVALICCRTLLLSGLPTIGPDPLFALWHAIGFTLVEPAGTLGWTLPQQWDDVPALFLDWTFRPQRLSHVIITWVGNVWLWLPLIAVAATLLLRVRTKALSISQLLPPLALIVTGLALAFGIRYLVRGSDGNYFLFALLPALMLGAAAMFRRIAFAPAVLTLAIVCTAAFATMQAGYSFISGAWTPGTRAWDMNFGKSWKQMRKHNRGLVEYAGLARVADHLREAPGHPRVTGEIEIFAMFALPARFENVETISYSRPEYTRDADSLLQFMHVNQIDYLVLPRDDAGVEFAYTAVLREAAAKMQRTPGMRRIEDRRYVMFDASGVAERDWLAMIEQNGTSSIQSDDDGAAPIFPARP